MRFEIQLWKSAPECKNCVGQKMKNPLCTIIALQNNSLQQKHVLVYWYWSTGTGTGAGILFVFSWRSLPVLAASLHQTTRPPSRIARKPISQARPKFEFAVHLAENDHGVVDGDAQARPSRLRDWNVHVTD